MASVASISRRLLSTDSSNAVVAASNLKWALGGWSLFIAENVILSENRSAIINVLGDNDETYHIVYGTCSTIAVASILYSYRKLLHESSSLLVSSFRPIGAARLGIAGALMSTGLILASQTAPKLQIPIEWIGATASEASELTSSSEENTTVTQTTPRSSFKVRCPFDFTDRKKNGDDSSSAESAKVTGIERISRHPGLWAFGLVAAGNAALQPTTALTLWMLGPLCTAWVGGSHSDSRYRRGLGGTMDPVYDAQTSNIPFAAMLTGQQAANSLYVWVTEEMKPLNAAVAVSIACVWVASRGRMSHRRASQVVQPLRAL